MVRAAAHELIIEIDSEVTASDAGGFPVLGVVTTNVVRGSIHFLGAAEIEKAGAMGVTATAAAHVPHGTEVAHNHRIKVEASTYPPIDAELTGTWLVSYVQHTRPHLRVLLRREDP